VTPTHSESLSSRSTQNKMALKVRMPSIKVQLARIPTFKGIATSTSFRSTWNSKPVTSHILYGSMMPKRFSSTSSLEKDASEQVKHPTPAPKSIKEEVKNIAKFLDTPETTAEKMKLIQTYIENHYSKNHTPLGFPRAYGPPYTDVKTLESLPEHCFSVHIKPTTFGDHFAKGLVEFFKIFTRLFFRDKYTHHAVVLETVAAVPGMVAGMARHLKSLRRMERDHGWICKLLEEAENERMHLLTWMQIVQPTFLERLLVMGAQAFYTPFYGLLYLTSPKVAHRFVGYLEETAVEEYTHFLHAIDAGKIINVDAPDIAKVYWNLPPDAKLRDVVLAVRADEAMHRDVNHTFSHKSHMGQH